MSLPFITFNFFHAFLLAKLLQSCLTLCDSMDWNLRGSSVPGFLQARILEWVATSFSGGLPNPGTEPTYLAAPVL